MLPSPKILVRMMAQKRGLPLDDYARTTGFQEFLGEVSAWYSGFMTPLNTIMQAFIGDSEPGERAPTAAAPRRSSRRAALQAKYAGKKVNFYDLDTEQGQLSLIYGEKTHGMKRVDTRPVTPAKHAAKRLY